MKGSKSVLCHADYSYPMNHRPLWISKYYSSRILNRSDWQDSSFETLARLMVLKTLGGEVMATITALPQLPARVLDALQVVVSRLRDADAR
jgi:hypothetical protein